MNVVLVSHATYIIHPHRPDLQSLELLVPSSVQSRHAYVKLAVVILSFISDSIRVLLRGCST